MKKVLSWILVFALCLSLFPGVALAEAPEEATGEIAPVTAPAEEEVPEEPVEEETPAAPAEPEEAAEPSGEIAPVEPEQAGEISAPDAAPAKPAAPQADVLPEPVSGSCGEALEWTLGVDGVLTISGSGSMISWESGEETNWYLYRNAITAVVLSEGVEDIGSYAFSDCSFLSSVTIPASLKSIGSYAFLNCKALEALSLPEGLTEISEGLCYGCSSLESVSIPATVTEIGSAAFYHCSSLLVVTLPDSGLTVGESAFNGCIGLKSVTLPSSAVIGSSAFFGCDSVEEVYIDDLNWWLGQEDGSGQRLPHGDLYLDGQLLTQVSIPAGTTAIRPYAFYRAAGLEQVSLPASLSSFGENAFGECTGVSRVDIEDLAWWLGLSDPEGDRTPHGSLYLDGQALTDLAIPDGSTALRAYAFTNCASLETVTLPASLKTFGSRAFAGCGSVTRVNISDLDVWLDLADADGTSLPHGDLYLNGKLVEELIVPARIKSIRPAMFKNMSGLLQLSFPRGMTTVGAAALENCAGLISVTFPSSLSSLGSAALKGCTGLQRIRFNGNAPAIAEDAFSGVTALGQYPSGNSSWTSSVRQPYGGNVTWKALPCGECGDNLYWEIDANGRLSITGTGAMWSWNSSSVPWYNWRETVAEIALPAGLTSIGNNAFNGFKYVTEVSIPDGVTSIGNYAFQGCSLLENVRIPDTVSRIGDSAFCNCNKLKIINLPEGLTSIYSSTFHSCRSLTSVVIPSTVTSIESCSFYSCSSLTEIVIPESVASIGSQAFERCSSLTSVTLSSGINNIGNGAFFGCGKVEKVFIDDLDWWMRLVTTNSNMLPHGDLYLNGEPVEEIVVPEGILGLRAGMFEGMKSLKKVSLPASLREIGSSAFSGCSALTSVGIQEGVLSIKDSAFYGCSSLESIRIPTTVNEIGGYAFSGCSSLSGSVTIPAGVASIGTYTFYNCSSLESISIPSTVTEIGESAFQDCDSLTEVKVPASVTSVGAFAFSSCDKLESVSILAGDVSWRNWVFSNCAQLKNLSLAEGLTSIGVSMFRGCKGLEKVTIPASVTSIGEQAFYESSGLKEIVFLGDAPTFGNDALYGTNSRRLYPADNASWTADKLQGFGTYSYTWIPYRDEPTYYTVSFDANGGNSAPSAQFKGHNVDLTLTETTPSRSYYGFQGWATDPEATEAEYAPGAAYSANGDVTLYAVWKINTYTVHYDAKGGEGAPEDQIKTHGVDLTLSEVIPTREGYTFVTWNYTDPWGYGRGAKPGGVFDGNYDVTLSAGWQINTYTVSYDANGGTGAPSDQTKTYDQDLTLSSRVPSRTGYTFLGWSTDAEATEPAYAPGAACSLNENVTLYAVWQIHTFTLTYHANGGAGAPDAQTKTYGVALTLSETEPTREGHTFLGWSTNAAANFADYQPGDSFTENYDVTLYAVWKIHSFTVRYDANGGYGAPAEQTKIYGQELRLSSETPRRTGYSFLGWATTAEATTVEYAQGASYSANADLTLYALWQINTYTLRFDANGGSGAPARQTKTHGVALTLPETVPTRTGYSFLGWASEASASSAGYQPGGSFSENYDMTLYAVWQADTYTVHFDANGGVDAPKDMTKTYGVSLQLNGQPSREGHRFLGWARSADASYAQFQPDSYYNDNEPVTLYAVWQVYTYPVVYVVGKNAQGPSNTFKTWGKDLVLSSMVPVAEGYDFMGWSLNNQSGIPDYQPGDTLTEEGGANGEAITLYAVWQIKVFLVSYNANGGEMAPAPQLKTFGRALNLSTSVPRRSGYNFLGWSTSSTATAAEYQAGDSFTANADTVLYAVWERADQTVPTTAALTLGDTTGAIGREFTVDLLMEENPGVMFLSFSLDYDKAVMEFVSVEEGSFSGWTYEASKNCLVWDNDADQKDNGRIARLRFRVKDGIEPGTARIGISELYAANFNEEVLQMQAGACTVTLANRHPGDVNGDGTVDGLDLIRLRKFMMGIEDDVQFIEGNANVNGDDVIDILDLVRMRKFLAKMDVVLE